MPASYPSSIKTWTDKVDLVDDVFVSDVNGAYAEIIAIETELASNKSKIAKASDVLITSTSAQQILTLTPHADGNYHVGLYFRVITGVTNVTLVLTWYDGSGSLKTDTIYSAQACPIGEYSIIPRTINAKTTGAITITMTASIANRVYASPSIEGV
jgi:hypothetical protein